MSAGGIRADIPGELSPNTVVIPPDKLTPSAPPAPSNETPAKAPVQNSWIDSLWQKCVQLWGGSQNKPSQGKGKP